MHSTLPDLLAQSAGADRPARLAAAYNVWLNRLWDIDIIINRALVYGSLTILLVSLSIGLILALQALVHTLTGTISEQPLVVVGSTLVIAALFQPLRRGLQALIMRWFAMSQKQYSQM